MSDQEPGWRQPSQRDRRVGLGVAVAVIGFVAVVALVIIVGTLAVGSDLF